MKHLRSAMALVAVLALSTVAYAASFTGEVKSIAPPPQMALNAANPLNTLALTWTAKTEFTLGGKPASSSDMAVGDHITTTYTTSNGVNVATFIAISKPRPPQVTPAPASPTPTPTPPGQRPTP